MILLAVQPKRVLPLKVLNRDNIPGRCLTFRSYMNSRPLVSRIVKSIYTQQTGNARVDSHCILG